MADRELPRDDMVRPVRAVDEPSAAILRHDGAALHGTVDNPAPAPTYAELERAKAAAEAANEAKSRYLVAVSHEIRSPLNAIYGYAQLLERGDDVSSTEAGAVIRRSAKHLSNLVESLLEISRIESGVLRICSDVIDIRALLEEVVDMFRVQAGAKGLQLRLDVSERLPDLVKTDEKRLRQILINLLSNAVKYTREGGAEIKVGYRNQVADIVVRDTGIGIAPDEIERIFEPFERGASADALTQPGIGLGLAITRVLVRVMGGDITVTSIAGAGSSFRLKLMLPPPSGVAAVASSGGRIEGYLGSRRTLLVVDDDPAQLAILQSLLHPLGFVVYAAGSGLEAIALAEHCAPDLVILDIQMPGISGWETAARLRAARGRDLKIVMASANVAEAGSGGGEADHDAFVAKPVDFDTLLAVVGAQLQLIWESAGTRPSADDRPERPPLPDSARSFVEQLRYLADIGHVAAIELKLTDFAREFPAMAGLVADLRSDLAAFDLRALLRRLDDAEPR